MMKLTQVRGNTWVIEAMALIPFYKLDSRRVILLDTGLRRVLISMGGDGIFAADHNARCHVPCYPGTMMNTTGCGDASMAAVAWAYLEGTDLEGTTRAALAAGAVAMESAETINPAMSAEALRERMGR